VRIELFGDEVERVSRFDVMTGELLGDLEELIIFPATHYVAGDERTRNAIASIEVELGERLRELEQGASCSRPSGCGCGPSTTSRCSRSSAAATAWRTTADTSTGERGEAPYTLLDYFPDDWLLVIDESHVTVPQLHGQFAGDRSRQRRPRRARFPPPVGQGQPPTALRGARGPRQPVHLSLRHSVRLRVLGLEPGRRADRQADRLVDPRSSSSRPRGRSTI